MGKYVGSEHTSESREITTSYFTAAPGQTSFASSYTPGYVAVTVNGAALFNNGFTAADGLNVVLTTPCVGGEKVIITGRIASAPYDYYTKQSIDTKIPLIATATGTDAAISITVSSYVTALVHGASFMVKTAFSNSISNPTLSVNGLAPRVIVKGFNSALDSFDILAGGWSQFLYDSVLDKFVLQNPSSALGGPAGTVYYVTQSTAPPGTFKANGAAVSRTTYANLYSKIGTTYGAGDGVNTYNLPDLRGLFPRGLDDGRGVDPGRGLGTYQGDAIRNITGSLSQGGQIALQGASGAFYVAANIGGFYGSGAGSGPGVFNFDASRVVPTAGENRPQNIALLACIKY